jgi:hypothetical protein
MPQFDIPSFYPQITFFAGIFLIFYVLLSKTVLPKVGQNLKLSKRVAAGCNALAAENCEAKKGLKHINLLSHIYKPNVLLAYLASREALCIIFLARYADTLISSYLSSLHWLIAVREANAAALLRLSKVYFVIVVSSRPPVAREARI